MIYLIKDQIHSAAPFFTGKGTNMKRFKIIALIVVIALAAALLVSCEADKVSGTYTAFAETVAGYTVETMELESVLTLDKDGTGYMTMNEDEGPVTEWTVEKGALSITTGGELMTGTVEEGIIKIDLEDGYALYYAAEGADTSSVDYMSKEEFAGIVENQTDDAVKEAMQDKIGSYRLISMSQGEESQGEEEIAKMEQYGGYLTLTLNEDGTGEMDQSGEKTALTWTAGAPVSGILLELWGDKYDTVGGDTITAEGQEIPYTFEDGVLTMTYGEKALTFKKMTDEEKTERDSMLELSKLMGQARGYFYGNGPEGYDRAKAQELFTQAAEAGRADANYYLGSLAERLSTPDRYAQALALYEKAIEGGSLLGLIGKGDLLANGSGVAADPAQAMALYQQAVDQGCAEANIGIAELYEAGKGVEADGAKALECYGLASEGYEFGLSNLALCRAGLMYEKGHAGITADPAKAAEYYQQAIDAGYRNGYRFMGNLYHDGAEGVEQDYAKAKEYYEQGAAMGDRWSYYSLGLMYYHGKGVDVDGAKALEYLIWAADEGAEDAMYTAGLICDRGISMEPDYAKAMEWYTKAADLGDGDAMNALGNMYYHAHGVEQDYAKSTEWFQKSSDAGCTAGTANLAHSYAYGEGVETDGAKALELFTQVESMPWAQAQIGILYYYGNGVAEDDAKAVEYFNRSIEGGSDLGYLRLGIAYEEGKGVAQDLNSALDCFHKALEIIGGPNASGSISADNVKKELDRMVTAGTIDQATSDAIMAGNVG